MSKMSEEELRGLILEEMLYDSRIELNSDLNGDLIEPNEALDGIIALINSYTQEKCREARIDEYLNHMPCTKYPNHYQIDKAHLDDRIAQLNKNWRTYE